MPNVTNPNGFVPLRNLDGSPYNGAGAIYAVIPASNAVATFIGDVVFYEGSAEAAGSSYNGFDLEGMATVGRSASGSVTSGVGLAGVVRNILFDSSNLGLRYRTASTKRVVVLTPPDLVYEVQEDAVGGAVAAASVGLNTAYESGAGNTTTGVSTATLDSSAVNTTATLPLKILGLVKRVNNALNTGGAGTDQARFEVTFNASHRNAGTTGV